MWYGVQQVLLGEVPIRDFMAYDPGRYYWSAALAGIFGDNGIMGLRAAVAIFQALGLFVGLFLVAQSQRNKSRIDIAFILLSAITLIVWMYPRHKLFDISISIFLIGILTYLATNPAPKRYFIVGICVGFIAVFGRNHGVYGAVASLGVIGWLFIQNRSVPSFFKVTFLWATGVAIGFSPVILMVLLIPGFGVAFWEGIRFLLDHKVTNLPLPVPWPWTVDFAAASAGDIARGLLIGLFFLGTLVFAALSVVWIIYRKIKGRPVPPVLVASAALAFPYAHYAFSRADVGHLALGIFPFLIGLLTLLAASPVRIKWPLALALSAASIWVMHVVHPGWQCLASKQCVPVEVSGNQLQAHPGTANNIALLRQLDERFTSNGRTFIATPFWPGAYALLERKSPMWEIYALFPRPEKFEQKEIERIKASNPGFVFVYDIALDGRDELRFKNTHPLTHQFILDNFDPVPISENPAFQTYKAQRPGQ